MGCDNPLKGFKSKVINPSGKRGITFNPLEAVNSQDPYEIPCGQCTGCRLERSRQWAVRMKHEASLHDANCFLTLTYDDDHIPDKYSLRKADMSEFMKALRTDLDRKGQGKARFFGCGEYGEQGTLRPHLHLCLFGQDFSADRVLYGKNDQGKPLWTSETLTRIWGKGLAVIGQLEFESAAYVARYTLKKVNGSKKDDGHYFRPHPLTGERVEVEPEFALMSRRPGIGAAWLDKFKSDVFPGGFIVVNGVPQGPPLYYKRKLSEAEQLKLSRDGRKRALRYKADRTKERRAVKTEIRDRRIAGRLLRDKA